MSVLVSIMAGILTAIVAWSLLKSIAAAIFFGVLLVALVEYLQTRS